LHERAAGKVLTRNSQWNELLSVLNTPNSVSDQRNNEQHQKYKENDLRNTRRRECDSSEAQKSGQERNDKKHQSIVQHYNLLDLN
jgi:hypothetical protein